MEQLSTPQIIIRPASPGDIPVIQHISFKTWPVAYGNILSREQLSYMLEKMYSSRSLLEQMNNRHWFFLALHDHSPVGFASFSRLEQETFKLHKLYILPESQKTGAGKELLQFVETAAKNLGGKLLQLNVNRNNNAKFFYEKNGFSIIKQEDIDIGDGYFMNDYVMEKSLID